MKLEDLAADGEIVETMDVAFTVSNEDLLKKMKDYLLADPFDYVREFVSAEAAKNASRINIKALPWKFQMIDDGEGYTEEEISSLLKQSFFPKEGALKKYVGLSRGLVSALKANGSLIKIESVRDGVPITYTVDPQFKINKADEASITSGTKITVEKKSYFVKENMYSLLKFSASKESQKVMEVCSSMNGCEVYLNFRQINHESSLKNRDMLIFKNYTVNDSKIEIGIPKKKHDDLNKTILIYKNGFMMEGREWKTPFDLSAIIDNPNFVTDLSGKELITDNQEFRSGMNDIDSVIDDLFRTLLEELPDKPKPFTSKTLDDKPIYYKNTRREVTNHNYQYFYHDEIDSLTEYLISILPEKLEELKRPGAHKREDFDSTFWRLVNKKIIPTWNNESISLKQVYDERDKFGSIMIDQYRPLSQLNTKNSILKISDHTTKLLDIVNSNVLNLDKYETEGYVSSDFNVLEKKLVSYSEVIEHKHQLEVSQKKVALENAKERKQKEKKRKRKERMEQLSYDWKHLSFDRFTTKRIKSTYDPKTYRSEDSSSSDYLIMAGAGIMASPFVVAGLVAVGVYYVAKGAFWSANNGIIKPVGWAMNEAGEGIIAAYEKTEPMRKKHAEKKKAYEELDKARRELIDATNAKRKAERKESIDEIVAKISILGHVAGDSVSKTYNSFISGLKSGWNSTANTSKKIGKKTGNMAITTGLGIATGAKWTGAVIAAPFVLVGGGIGYAGVWTGKQIGHAGKWTGTQISHAGKWTGTQISEYSTKAYNHTLKKVFNVSNEDVSSFLMQYKVFSGPVDFFKERKETKIQEKINRKTIAEQKIKEEEKKEQDAELAAKRMKDNIIANFKQGRKTFDLAVLDLFHKQDTFSQIGLYYPTSNSTQMPLLDDGNKQHDHLEYLHGQKKAFNINNPNISTLVESLGNATRLDIALAQSYILSVVTNQELERDGSFKRGISQPKRTVTVQKKSTQKQSSTEKVYYGYGYGANTGVRKINQTTSELKEVPFRNNDSLSIMVVNHQLNQMQNLKDEKVYSMVEFYSTNKPAKFKDLYGSLNVDQKKTLFSKIISQNLSNKSIDKFLESDIELIDEVGRELSKQKTDYGITV